MAVILEAFEVAKTISGNSPFTLDLPEAANQTFKKGAVLTLNSVGHVIEASDDEGQVLGVAAEPGENNSVAGAATTHLWVANADTIFRGNVSGALSGGAASAAVTHSSDIGRSFSIAKDTTTGFWVVDKSDTTNRIAMVIDHHRVEPVGETNGRVHFLFHGSVRALEATS